MLIDRELSLRSHHQLVGLGEQLLQHLPNAPVAPVMPITPRPALNRLRFLLPVTGSVLQPGRTKLKLLFRGSKPHLQRHSIQ